MEESSFHMIFSVILPSHLINILHYHCHDINYPSKMFLTFASIIVFSSIIRFLNHRRQCLSSMNPGKMIIPSKKSSLCIVPQIRVWLCNLFLGLEMAIWACFGVSPFSFRRRKFSALMEEREMFGEVENQKRDTQAKCKNEEFMVMTELRNKTLALRDLLDLSPCVGSTSVHDLLVLTLEDLGALYPCAQQFQVSETEGRKWKLLTR